MPATVVITGGSGFLGRKVAEAILRRQSLGCNGREVKVEKLVLADVAKPESPIPGALCVEGDITDPTFLESLITEDVISIFHLAAVLSAQAESDFDLGMKVNLDGTRAIVERCRDLKHRPKLIFTSSVAIFGSPPGKDSQAVHFTEETLPTPQSSYGTQKAMCELLIADASRKGFIDGCCVRLPTIVIRPGKPNQASSSFASSILREPLQGQKAICPVSPNLTMWIQSPRTVVKNLLKALGVNLENKQRILTLPGITVTVEEMVEALERAGGDSKLITWEHNPTLDRILSSWPGAIDTPYAQSLDFVADESMDAIVQAFIEDDMRKSSYT